MRVYRAVFLSDIHLGSAVSQTGVLLEFLKDIQTDRIYLVGDIIDLWALKRSWYWPRDHNDVVRKIFEFSDTIPLIYVVGNHDELFKFLVGYEFGNLKICHEAEYKMFDGRKLLVIHGDAFDHILMNAHWLGVLGSYAYDYILIVNRWINLLFGRPKWSLAGYLKKQVTEGRAFLKKFESTVIDEAGRRGYSGVITGHTHVAAIKTVKNLIYMNIGDMVDSCTVLVEDLEGNFSHIYLKEPFIPGEIC